MIKVTFLVLSLFLFAGNINPAFAQGSWSGTDCVQGTGAEEVATIKGITCLVRNIITPIPALLLLTAIFMAILAGGRIIMAGSDPKALSTGWNTLTYAIIGIVLLSLVWFVFILIERFTGAPVTQFGI